MKTVIKSAVVAAAVLLFSFGSAFAAGEGLPAEVVISAIQTAIAGTPGLIKDVEIEKEGGKLIVEVKILDEKGTKTKVKIDPETKAIIR